MSKDVSGGLRDIAADTLDDVHVDKGNNKKIWASIAQLVTPVSALSLLVSVIYDWGYLSGIGLSFSDVPTTIADHIRTALVWAPMTISGLLLGVVLFVLSPGSKETEEKSVSAFKRYRDKLVILICTSVVLAYFLWGDIVAGPMILAVALLSSRLVAKHINHPLFAGLSIEAKVLIITIIPLVFALHFAGSSKGAEQLHRSPETMMRFSSSDLPEKRVSVLRYLDRGVLVASKEETVMFVRWEQIESIEQPASGRLRRNKMCRWFRIGCDLTPVASKEAP